jgi:3-deoxy-manno-octulosonate cytidylyltransferase (CMP-KDO synthetase)
VHPVTFRDPFERTLQPLRTVVVIPARYDSTRLPGKALADIGGRPMIEHVYRRAAEATGIDAVIVATDDERIAAAVAGFGGAVRMTSGAHQTGTDRVAEVASALGCEVVVNLQGDEPAIDPRMIAQVAAPFAGDPALQMATLKRRITDAADYSNPSVVKVVSDLSGHALYFSRAPLPARAAAGTGVAAYQHVGLYAYRRTFLLQLAALPRTPLEQAESLEQLRALEHGFRILTLETPFDSLGVDTPEDLERARRQLQPVAEESAVGSRSGANTHARRQ